MIDCINTSTVWKKNISISLINHNFKPEIVVNVAQHKYVWQMKKKIDISTPSLDTDLFICELMFMAILHLTNIALCYVGMQKKKKATTINTVG